MNISTELQKFIEDNIDLIESRKCKLIFEKAGELSLELCKILREADTEYSYYARTTSDEEFFKNIFYSFLVITDNDYCGYMGNTPTHYNDEGFELDDNAGGYVSVDFDPITRKWSYFDKWDTGDASGTYKMEGTGFDNLVYNLDEQQHHISGWFTGATWSSEDCFIGDRDRYPLTILDLHTEFDDEDDKE